jgi:hypothetical protein
MFIIYEGIQLLDENYNFVDYLDSRWNIFDILMHISFTGIYVNREIDNYDCKEKTGSESVDLEKLLCSIMFFLIFIKLLFYVRISETFGRMNWLLWNCIIEMWPFLVFFFSLIIMFTFVFWMTEVNFDFSDYPHVPKLV